MLCHVLLLKGIIMLRKSQCSNSLFLHNIPLDCALLMVRRTTPQLQITTTCRQFLGPNLLERSPQLPSPWQVDQRLEVFTRIYKRFVYGKLCKKDMTKGFIVQPFTGSQLVMVNKNSGANSRQECRSTESGEEGEPAWKTSSDLMLWGQGTGGGGGAEARGTRREGYRTGADPDFLRWGLKSVLAH